MQKSITAVALFALLIAPLGMGAVANAATPWDTTGSYIIRFNLGGDYDHDAFLTQDVAGSVTGNGGYPAGSPFVYAWTITSGSVVGSAINLTMDYTAGAVGTTMQMMGVIAPNGSMSGTWNDNLNGGYREGTWATVSGNATPVNVDSDNDGVLNDADKCPGTTADAAWSVGWGNNRWQVQNNGGVLTWYQNKVKKGVATPTAGETLAYTYGCNGHQILAMLNEKYGSVMNGHLKYGLSSSVLEDFHKDMNDGVLDGRYYLETVTVPASGLAAVSSLTSLLPGKNYVLKASGTANAGDGIVFDADYSFRTPTSVTWTDAVSTYESYGDTLLDLKVNGGFVNWDNDATYNTNHTYEYHLTGSGSPVSLLIYDVYYPNNTGSLSVDVYAEL